MKVADLVKIVDEIAPLETAEPWDNVGLLVGNLDEEVTGVMLCVDATLAVMQRAIAQGCNVILSHHPLMFGGVKHLRQDEYEGALLRCLVKNDLNLIAAHTNLDEAQGGVEDALASALGIQVDKAEQFVRCGTVAQQSEGDFLLTVKEFLNPQAVFYGDVNREVSRVAVSCGGGGEFFREAMRMGATLFVTGEMKHHERIEAQGCGMDVIIAGHEETEFVVLKPLKKRMEAALGEEKIVVITVR